jgi:hypothetical protein
MKLLWIAPVMIVVGGMLVCPTLLMNRSAIRGPANPAGTAVFAAEHGPLATSASIVAVAWASDPDQPQPAATNVPYDAYDGYFVSNQFEPDAEQSFVVLASQREFDRVFGVAMVMHDKSHRLAKDAFKEGLVLATVKRGNAVWTFRVDSVTVDSGVVQLRYRAKSRKSDSAGFACPLILSIPKGSYKAVEFIENKKAVHAIPLGEK